MIVEQVDTLIIGGGQAGIAMSEHLGSRSLSHLVLERARIAESWRSRRWDSLVANGPAWHDRFPNKIFSDIDPDAFVPKESIARYFEEYAEQIACPIRCGVEVMSLTEMAADRGFRVETSDGVIEARNVVVATGPFQRPIVPAIIPANTGLNQIHSNDYRNPEQLPSGGVLVVGAGSSGVQIADELLRSGRKVHLSVGPHNRPPRRYRGKDFCWWLGALGKWDARKAEPGLEHVTIAVSGARGGYTIDFRKLAAEGMTLLGMTQGWEGGVLRLAPDLAANIAHGDADYLSILAEADALAEREGLDLPEEKEAHIMLSDPACVTDPILTLDLSAAGITSVIWATGYAVDYGWAKVDTFDASGRPIHQDGVSKVPGLYFLGLPWLSRRASAFIWGVWADADHLAAHIASRTPTTNTMAAACEDKED